VPVPPTVLLVDGLNTERASQMQVHRQMVHMLASIPEDVPVAVFLLGRRLKMIQNFTTEPKLLKTAVQKTSSVESDNATQVEPQDDPDALSAFLEDEPNFSASSLMALQQFEREVYAAQMDTRVRETLEALRAIARHVAGYPGRKNLLWISSSFPIAINPDIDLGFSGIRNYQDQMAVAANALADAKVAVYPVDPGGLQVQSMFQASTRMRGNPVTGRNSVGRTIQREDQSRFNRQASMQSLADQTGGIICVNNNDLGDCVRRAVNDGSAFYEIAYYPDSSDWHGEFHKIAVKSNRSGLHLAYRQGYFARPEGGTEKKSAELQEAACQDLLTSTSVMIVAKSYPADKPGEAKFLTAISPTTVTFVPHDDGSHQLMLKIAVCSFDKSGKPLQFVHQDFSARLTDKQYAEVQAKHGFLHTIVINPVSGTTMVRLLVKDLATGLMGSVNLPYPEVAAQATAPSSGVAAPDVH
jgi:VWFA-related protein